MTKQRELNRDILISGLGLTVLYYFFPRVEILIVGSAYLPLCFIIQKLKVANHQFWKTLTKVMEKITSPVLFGAIFFLILLPIGLLYRVFGKKKKQTDSTFQEVSQSIDKAFFEVPW